MTRFKFLALAAAVGLTSCGRAAAPPAVIATPVAAVIDPSDSMKPDEPPAPKDELLADGGSFPFPDDSGGKALAKALTPVAPPAMPAAVPVAPRERKLPAFLDAPGPTLPDAANSPPRLALAPTREVRPVPLPDRVPLDLGVVIPDLPARPDVPTGSLVRTPARDVSQPAELPPLSPKPVADRAPLNDPTVEFTAASVVSPTLPLRTAPAGFVRINLPDPFEHAGAAKVRTPVAEDPNRVLPR